MIRFVHERGLAHVDVAPLGLADALIDIWLRCRPKEVSIQYYSLFKALGSAFSYISHRDEHMAVFRE